MEIDALPLETMREKNEVNNALSEKNFDQDWSYPTKIAFLLTLSQRPLTSEEIHKELKRLDRAYSRYLKPKATLSVYLTNATKRGRIKKIKLPGIKNLLFAIPEWVNENNEIITKYKLYTNQFRLV